MTTAPSPDFTPRARNRWEKVPQWAQEKIRESVWCTNCLKGMPIDLRVGRMEDETLVFEGFCKICGHDVVRLIGPEE